MLAEIIKIPALSKNLKMSSVVYCDILGHDTELIIAAT